MAKEVFEIVIVGAGLASFSAANALVLKGHHVKVFEKTPTIHDERGGAIGLGPNATRLLAEYGCLERARDICGEYVDAVYHRRWADGSILMETGKVGPGGMTGRQFGYPGLRGQRRDVQKVMYDSAVAKGVVVEFGCVVKSVDVETPAITLEDGRVIKADILVGADGINSVVRTAINGVERAGERQYTGIDDYMYQIPCEVIEANPRLRYLSSAVNFWWGPSGAAIIGPSNKDGKKTMFFEFCIVGGNQGVEGESKRDVDVDIGELQRNFEDWDPVLVEMLTFANKTYVWRLAHTDPDVDWVSESGRLVLIGDAAAALLPHTGSGASVAIESGAALAECIARAKTISDIPATLHAYEQIRKPRNKYMAVEGLSRSKFWHVPDGPEQQARDEQFRKVWRQNQAAKEEAERTAEAVRDANGDAKKEGATNGTKAEKGEETDQNGYEHMDDPPPLERMDLRTLYVWGHNTIEFVSRFFCRWGHDQSYLSVDFDCARSIFADISTFPSDESKAR